MGCCFSSDVQTHEWEPIELSKHIFQDDEEAWVLSSVATYKSRSVLATVR
jgi:hypothetical protein